ncbi:hypothetical protein POPTR_007G005600v4 [Populus trichocarpa]|uniref:Uncharacterized protein n=1 Tax=Populus trichocarpa TaxID=3694 RepID=A0ACC0SNQ5_POPTR|nr:hypothetical protein POPTR_007G005600v4 [Populus trichocarpa]
MGNCQAAEAATVVIQHPGNKIERIYWSVSAHEIMNSNPGHYVALVVTSPTTRTENGLPLKQLKLLRPDDTLLIGHVYRLVSFEDVLKEFAAKKCVKLGKLLKESRGLGGEMKRKNSSDLLNPISNSDNSNSIKVTWPRSFKSFFFLPGRDRASSLLILCLLNSLKHLSFQLESRF